MYSYWLTVENRDQTIILIGPLGRLHHDVICFDASYIIFTNHNSCYLHHDVMMKRLSLVSFCILPSVHLWIQSYFFMQHIKLWNFYHQIC